MRLKVATTIGLCLGIIMLLAAPLVFAHWRAVATSGIHESHRAALRLASQVYLYLLVVIIDFLVTAICCLLMIRQIRIDYTRTKIKQVTDLVEASRNDLLRRKAEASQAEGPSQTEE